VWPVESLKKDFTLTLFWYNPNIYPPEERERRLADVKKIAKIYGTGLLIDDTDVEKWFELAKGLESEPEGGKRCEKCFEMRLGKTAHLAKKNSFEWFATTLSMGPQKKAETINEWGKKLAEEYDLNFYVADFKKQDGFRKSVELGRKYGFYRQNYCGCVFSIKTSKH